MSARHEESQLAARLLVSHVKIRHISGVSGGYIVAHLVDLYESCKPVSAATREETIRWARKSNMEMARVHERKVLIELVRIWSIAYQSD